MNSSALDMEGLEVERKHVLWLRWLLVIATSYLLRFTGDDPFGLNNTLILFFIASNIVLGLLPERVIRSPLFYYIMVPFDTAFVGLSMYLSGAASTDFYLTFFLIIIIASIGQRLSYVLVGAVAIALFYCWLMWTTNVDIPPMRIPFLLVVAGFIGHLTQQPTVARARLRRVIEDKHQLEETQSRLEQSEAKFRRLAETLTAAIFINRGDRFLYVNPATEVVTGYAREELLELNFWDLIAPESRETMEGLTPLHEQQPEEPQRYEIKILTKSGEERWMDVSVGVIEFEGRLARLGTCTDITERRSIESQLKHSVAHDNLTGLPNRARLTAELEGLLRRSRTSREIFSVLYLDLDRFKVVNDSLGHTIGDQLLEAVASRLQGCLRNEDMAARIGGDEFVLVLRDIKSTDEAMRVAERIHRNLTAPFRLDNQEVFISVSIGIALSSEAGSSPDELLHAADTAMYQAKERSKSQQHRSFQTGTHRRAAEVLKLEGDLRKALERQEFSLDYQPIVTLADGQLVGFEALARWKHAKRGWISPVDFIPMAEMSGVIIPLGWWVTREACRTMKQWQDQKEESRRLFINVNLSHRQFQQPDLVDQIDRILKETGLEPGRLNLEFTEGAVLENTEATAVKMLLLKSMGVRLVIDDFGTGYTLLSRLHRLPADMLKIDRSFVMGMDAHAHNGELVKMIVMIARTMGVDIVAEGIETEEQRRVVYELQCRYGQGFLFSRPLRTEDAEALVQRMPQATLPMDTPESESIAS